MDSGAADDRGFGASERVYRALMRAYPEEVRRRYAGEMVRYFGDLCREERLSRGAKGVTLLWARTLPDLLFTALQERGALFRRNAYLPAAPGTVARWGALCALLGGIMGLTLQLIGSLLGALSILTGVYSYGTGPLMQLFTLSMLLGALSLSSLGLFGLYGAVVARSGAARPGPLAGAGAISSVAAAFLWLSIGGYAIADQLASGSALFAPFEWLWNAGSFTIPTAILCWFLGLLLLGIAAARQRLPARLRILPLALLAFTVPCYLLRDYDFGAVLGNPVIAGIVMVFGQSLPFVGIASLGLVLLKDLDADEPLAMSGGPAARVAARGTARSARWPAGRAWVLTAFLLGAVLCAWAYASRDDLYRAYLGLQPEAQNVGEKAYVAGQRLGMEKTAGGARVTLASVYAEERRVIVGYEVEDLNDQRRVGGYPAELQPLLGFGYGRPTPREEKYLKEYGLGTNVVALTDRSDTDFRMAENSGMTSEGPDNMVEGPLQNMVAFEPEEGLEPGEGHRFRLEIPLVEEAVVPLEEKRLPPEPFPGKPFVFDFEIPVQPDP
ncbi:MAG: hypothetical protein AVDCRST_MAG01-01-696 [uncultured Rubrobacteraceae bacterium]|uniref:Uncharacterized protein n=1 Tax=uncultured Rubrobacteraceae bacterium TaxID=349277 RepID=A0A6J4NQP8_9ACTN|nr:MAG: hypothetical protein AVDCRST_MAG01-01-696 [uncultured Rubrobacteraceae bacterium]